MAALPAALGVGAHVFEHHGHGRQPEDWAGLAEVLVHGHDHEEGVPPHEHHVVPLPPVRPDAPPDLQVPAFAALEAAPEPAPVLVSDAPPWHQGRRLSGPSPPRLHLLCALLI